MHKTDFDVFYNAKKLNLVKNLARYEVVLRPRSSAGYSLQKKGEWNVRPWLKGPFQTGRTRE